MVSVDASTREQVRRIFLHHGFTKVGFADASPVEDLATPWVAAGRHAGMRYLERRTSERADPSALLPGARSVICVAVAYPATDGKGAIAGYARGEDYHRTMKAALHAASAEVRDLVPGLRARPCADTAPLLERAFAARAGLGWIGRNTMLLDEAHGPWMLLGAVITDADFPGDDPVADRCGTCTACVQACPTAALEGGRAPDSRRSLDARRCLSYWTIEHRGELEPGMASKLDGRAFGCDDCLAACPFPAAALGLRASTPVRAGTPPAPGTPLFRPRDDLAGASLAELERLARESFRRHFATTPIQRAGRAGLLRNLAAARASPARASLECGPPCAPPASTTSETAP